MNLSHSIKLLGCYVVYIKSKQVGKFYLKCQFHAARRNINHGFFNPNQNVEVNSDIVALEPFGFFIFASFQCVYFPLDLFTLKQNNLVKL